MFIIDVVELIARSSRGLKKKLRMAHLPYSVEEFVKRSLVIGFYASLALTFVSLLVLLRFSKPLLLLLVIFPLTFFLSYFFFMQTPAGNIKKRRREIDQEVLFAGRYLLIKMESGEPLFNSLIDASKSYGVCSKYFREIVDEINTGVPIEDALERAREESASEKFRKVLWQIITSLKTGTEVSSILRSTLKAITAEQILEIKAYGKKLNALMLFYMVAACVLPSLGMAMLIILSGFLKLTFSPAHFSLVLMFLVMVQVVFITMIKSIRPMVNL